jgi:putative SOS response-associated peptidase YedK
VAPTELAEFFELFRGTESWSPRYNIAPTQVVACVRREPADCERHLAMLRWGLIPSWAKDAKLGASLINARGETVATKPSFRSAFRKRRCLIPADGYFEWQPIGKLKQPFWIRRQDERPFAFAGLWEAWHSPEGPLVESCSIITTEATGSLAKLHNRRPVFLDPKDYDRWLDPQFQDAESLQEFLVPHPVDDLLWSAVNPIVNNARNQGPECIAAWSVPTP